MNFLFEFLIIFKKYLIEVLPYLFVGFLLSGIINEFIPAQLVEKHLGGKGLKPILYSTLVGTILPICCIGSLPIAVSLYRKGAKIGPVLAFLVATPATSISALMVCYGLLGLKFTAYIFLTVILMGLFIGIIGNSIKVNFPKNFPNSTCNQESKFVKDPICGMNNDMNKGLKLKHREKFYYFCSPYCQESFQKTPGKYIDLKKINKKIEERLNFVLKYSFWDMPREIGFEIFLGLILVALIFAVTPIGEFVNHYFSGGWGYLFSLVFGLMMYICSTASVPLVHAFISQGMNMGAGMALLLVGPVTSWGTILVLRKTFGNKMLTVYLTIISILALSFGFIYALI